ncbi:MAG: winged helix-turn-helix domain-containing protein [Lysobacterales bacterium]
MQIRDRTSSSPIRFDTIEIDGDGHRLRVDGVAVPLERKAFAVLLLLVQHPGRVFTRDEILDAVWGHSHISPGVLNRIVTLLRQALGESGESHRYLHTVHGVGYRFDLPVLPAPESAGLPESAVTLAPLNDATSSEPSNPAPAVENESAGGAPIERSKARWLVPAAIAAVVLAIIVAGVAWVLLSPPSTTPTVNVDAGAPRSIAVLPLTNRSNDPTQQFFADGVAQNLVSTLSQFEGLRVVGTRSSFRFRDSKEDGKAIGAKLGVDYLIAGSVDRAGDKVRITIELIRTADASVEWTQNFDRPYSDLFALQDEIALTVAGALHVKLLHAAQAAFKAGRPASGNLKAYSAFLEGAYFMYRNDAPRALEQYSEAVRLDPGYAQAWAWMSFTRTEYARFALAGDAARTAYAKAREEVDTALRLDPTFGESHATKAHLMAAADHDWNGALAEMRIGMSLVPETDQSHGAMSRLLATLGRMNEAIEETSKFMSGDPLSNFGYVHMARFEASLGRLDDAESSLRNGAQKNPDSRDMYASLRAHLAVLRGDAVAARAAAESMVPGPWRDRVLTLALQIGRDRAAADDALRRLEQMDSPSDDNAYGIARIHALRGDADKTFEWLDTDRKRGSHAAHYVLHDPFLLRFRDDPRLAAYCRNEGLPPPSGSEALGVDEIRARLAAKRRSG